MRSSEHQVWACMRLKLNPICRYITSLVSFPAGLHTDAHSETSPEAAYSPDARLESQVGQSITAILDGVLAAVHSVLGHQASARDSLMEVGLDSLGAVELKNSLSQQFDVELPATFTFDYPTPQAMAAYIASLKGVTDAGRAGQMHSLHRQPQADQRLVGAGGTRLGSAGLQAITGISVR